MTDEERLVANSIKIKAGYRLGSVRTLWSGAEQDEGTHIVRAEISGHGVMTSVNFLVDRGDVTCGIEVRSVRSDQSTPSIESPGGPSDA